MDSLVSISYCNFLKEYRDWQFFISWGTIDQMLGATSESYDSSTSPIIIKRVLWVLRLFAMIAWILSKWKKRPLHLTKDITNLSLIFTVTMKICHNNKIIITNPWISKFAASEVGFSFFAARHSDAKRDLLAKWNIKLLHLQFNKVWRQNERTVN